MNQYSNRPPAAQPGLPTLNLAECAREPIHIPGRIQPHGLLLAVREPELTIVQVSRNAAEFLGVPADDLLGRDLESVLPDFAPVRKHLERERLNEINPLSVTVRTGDGNRPFDAILHRSGGVLVVELEAAEAGETVSFQGFYHRVRGAVSRLQGAPDVDELCRIASAEVREITGFDRVMVYRFDEQWNGAVVAEDRRPDLEPFLGLHYPASDIPEQARRLYTVNWLRLISDVDAVPAELVPQANPQTGAPLDLTHSVLRAVSPVHIQYLKNMGVGASMSVSLMQGDRLWGLIACHHDTARRIPYVVRTACEFLGQVLSLQLSLKQERAEYDYRLRLKSVELALMANLAESEDLTAGLTHREPTLLAPVDATGAVICLGDGPVMFGETPPIEAVMPLLRWLDREHPREIFYTDSLVAHYSPAQDFTDCASGLLTAALLPAHRIVWFRPEAVRVVNWGGDPHHPAEADPGTPRLHPRRSFELWKETVRHTSLPWRPAELDAAAELRGALVDILFRRAEAQAKRDLERLNEQLSRSNSELDAFASITSHDLKEPLRGMRNYASFVLEDYAEHLPEDGRRKLETILKLSQRMEQLLDALLRYSRLGRVELAMQTTDLDAVLRGVLELLQITLEQAHVEVRVPRPLPTLRCDRARIGEVFNNLITNAAKYNDKPERWVEIGYCEPEPGSVEAERFYVRDNGIGIEDRHRTAVFEMFRRLHTRDRFGGGSGAGLALARRIVERHGGRMWVESTPGEGTTFWFTLSGSGTEEAAE